MSKKLSLSWAHPLVQKWFIKKYKTPTEPQKMGWPAILARQNTLIAAPTGSGKTFAAFLVCIERLIRQALAGNLPDEIKIIYISPLKALSNDIQKNLKEPLEEIIALANHQGIAMQEIRVLVRTGDTLTRDRQKMLKKPPHILVTTPESFYILLTAEKSRGLLKNTSTVIVDEIHALAYNKRGAHLALSLERLAALCLQTPLRVGLSATQKPIDKIAQFLVGSKRSLPKIINIGHVKQLELTIEVPSLELGAVASNELWDEIYDKIAKLTEQNRSILIFVNTRRLSERVAHHLAMRLGEEQVASHHGSLSRKIRLTVESKLKNGELKALVATASLELGIDIGHIDLVCQIGSPRAIGISLQRIGRSGHWKGAVSKGCLFATTRDELLECASLIYAIRLKDLDELIIPEQPLDILSQQIVATCATGSWQEKDLFALIKKAYPYQKLSKETFDSIIEMLSEGIAGVRGRYGAYLFRDQINHTIKGRRNSRLVAITCGGAIPENGLYKVISLPDEIVVGTLDEDFAIDSHRGDIILLGATSWKIFRVESLRACVLVEDAKGAPPNVPFWRGEAPARTKELSYYFSSLREIIYKKLENVDECIEWLQEKCGLHLSGAKQLMEYIKMGGAGLGQVPSHKRIIAERFFDESEGMQLIIHAPFGARINKAWGFALRKKFCRNFNVELQAAATDNGLNISLTAQHSFPLADIFHYLHPNTLQEVLIQAVLQSPLFMTRWRWNATRSLAIMRFRLGKKLPPHLIRMLSDDLLGAIFPAATACQDNLGGRDITLPSHPLITETMKDVLEDALDVGGLLEVITGLYHGTIQYLSVDTTTPSVFSHEILNANPYAFLDDAPLEERRARAVALRRILPEDLVKKAGQLDQRAIQEVKQQVWPDLRNADELHDTLLSLIALPEEKSWQSFFDELKIMNRVEIAYVQEKTFWFPREKKKTFSVLYPNALFNFNKNEEIEKITLSKEEALIAIVRGWLQHIGPTTSNALSERLHLPLKDIECALLNLESTGFVLRGYFEKNAKSLEWCERKLLARIHRLTLLKIRENIEPVSPAVFVRWLFSWQHLSKENKLQGEAGLLAVIKQLQGFEVPAHCWERQIFAKRIYDYSPDFLDHLCLRGVVGWGRLSSSKNRHSGKRIWPTRVVPITFFIREETNWMPARDCSEETFKNLSAIGKQIYDYLKQKGASFFSEIAHGVNHLRAEVEMGLFELVTLGLITNDGFDNLRNLIDPRRRLGKRGARLSSNAPAGRWSVLHKLNIHTHQTELESLAWILLKRYGIVFRDLLMREKIGIRWRDLLVIFRQLENSGEIQSGLFVQGFLGEQFGLPHAIESLRNIKRKPLAHEVIKISPADPLNLTGIILPGNKIPANSKKLFLVRDGIPIMEE